MEQKVGRYLNGLNHSIQKDLAFKDIFDMSDAIKYALKVEELHKSSVSIATPHPVSVPRSTFEAIYFECGKVGHKKSDCPQLKRVALVHDDHNEMGATTSPHSMTQLVVVTPPDSGAHVLNTKRALLFIVLLQYIPRFLRILPLNSELKRTVGVFAESAFAGAAYYLLWYILASHIVGAFWYLLTVERNDACWKKACIANNNTCNDTYLYCGGIHDGGFQSWNNISGDTLKNECSSDNPIFNFGIFKQALASGVVSNKKFVSKLSYCFWWGLQNLRYALSLSLLSVVLLKFRYIFIHISWYFLPFMFGKPTRVHLARDFKLVPILERLSFPYHLPYSGSYFCTSDWQHADVLAHSYAGSRSYQSLITYLQSLTIRLEEMRIKRRDSEQWMHHRLLPQDLRERVRRYDQYKWLETRGVDEENLVQSLPKDLRRDIKRHLCLALVKRVPLFENMDERLLDAICERLKPSLYTESTFIVREGEPVNEMLFIIRGRLESVTTNGGRSGFFNRGLLKEGDFCGEELLTWALDPRTGSNLPSSTRTVMALTEVEAFALTAEELKFVASQFRRLHSRQVQHTFRFYSQQWRTWAACFIQAAWRRHSKRKSMEEFRRREEKEMEAAGFVSGNTSSIAAAIYASRFAKNALRGVYRLRNTKSAMELVKLQKPPEPDFTADED
ncbi:hypothetical protein IFM89_018828 [Coptis chinensis]|uniref:Cyclic nucleotide-binding domain-containing protein n=1 Tax=Coptis chinensis TaxID=261450 RepID=A0A835GZP6_9MAGN|nr:hypothetical protein IFM89_018828 [Coptis chinensis]